MVRGSGGRPAGAGITLAIVGLAVVALAAVALTIAGCSQALPLGQTAAVQHHLAAPIVLQIVVSQPSSAAGSCPAGSARLPEAAEQLPGTGECYRRLGKPLTIRSAAVAYFQQPAANQQPANYGLTISMPAADRPALLAITTRAYHDRDQIAMIIAGRTWGVPGVDAPFSGPFEIRAQSAHQALQLQRTLIPSA
jgi:hypothetical protein